jgi:hypothetical protein
MDGKERRKAAAQQRNLGDVIYTRTFAVAGDGGGTQFYWGEVPYPQMSNEEAIETHKWNGPFNSKQEAEKDSQLALLGTERTR